MIIGRKAPGRPVYIADIEFNVSRSTQFYDDFRKAAKKLCYRDIVALSRYFRISERSIYAWHYGEHFPRRWDIMMDVIEWVGNGKPMRKQYQQHHMKGMF